MTLFENSEIQFSGRVTSREHQLGKREMKKLLSEFMVEWENEETLQDQYAV